MTFRNVTDGATLVERALAMMNAAPPGSLERAMLHAGELHDIDVPEDPLGTIVAHLKTCGPNDRILDAMALAIHGWDHREGAWAKATPPHSPERRRIVLERLGFNGDHGDVISARIPRVLTADLPIIIAEEHERWYDDKARQRGGFYWDHYARQLLPPLGRWAQRDVELLGLSIDDVIARLSDPCRAELYSVKGLVMGYVQSGKTSHFSGLIAKASDAGYRLIIVLAGTLDILRRQTQRRIDKEIVGRELLGAEEYGSDAEWQAFVSHGGRPSDIGAFDWERLTNLDDDYKTLKRKLSLLEFRPNDRAKPFNDPDNLRRAPARLVVIKKTPSRLRQLCQDLEDIKGLKNKLEHVPTLVIDDESDQASINTVNQQRAGSEGKRTSTNHEIGRLLSLLPRSQYVGYTATPFANFFINPEDAQDLFPKDFIISLRRPEAYMGVSDFYDFEMPYPEGDYRGNKNAYVRTVSGDDAAADNLPRAIDAFVLTGAIKLFRQKQAPEDFKFLHHTMLVHHAATHVVHETDKEVVEGIFRSGARYQSPRGMKVLEELYAKDFAVVSAVRAPHDPMPKSFKELKPFISACLTRICADKAVRVVNGAGRNRDDTPDFDARPVWAILVGGTKLSRGYTVEGLTISYYRRPTGAGDTLMQMGRWFGFRQGYRDLVRLFIGRSEKRGKSVLDLYDAFGAVCRDEEALREDLRKYSAEGLRPWQVPPLVLQHLPDLPPTSRNKMFNAEIQARDFAGEWTEKTAAPDLPKLADRNRRLADELVSSASVGKLERVQFRNGDEVTRQFWVRFGAASSDAILSFLREYKWAGGRKPLQLELDYIEGQVAKSRLRTWTVLLPQQARKVPEAAHVIYGVGPVTTVVRSRVSKTRFGVYSEPRHVDAAKAIAGVAPIDDASDALKALLGREQPVIVLYYVRERAHPKGPISVGFGIQYPGKKGATTIVWGARRGDQAGEVVVAADNHRGPATAGPRRAKKDRAQK